jgi:hypothetical protein
MRGKEVFQEPLMVNITEGVRDGGKEGGREGGREGGKWGLAEGKVGCSPIRTEAPLYGCPALCCVGA